MKGFGKVAGIGLAAVFAVLLSMTMVGGVFAGGLLYGAFGDPIDVEIPKAELTGVAMYGGVYTGYEGSVASTFMEDIEPVIVQGIDSISCPEGQTITATVPILGTAVISTIHMDTANLTNVLMKASGLTTTDGELTDVTMFSLPAPDPTAEVCPPCGLEQDIVSGTMYDLDSQAFFVSVDRLGYTNLSVSLTFSVGG